jgi:hypothetical protein
MAPPQLKDAKPAATAPDFSAPMPEFARVIRGLAHVPKAEVDAAIAPEKLEKRRAKKK